MTKILITGAGGYIGSVAASLFLEKGHEIVAVDNLSRGYQEPLEHLKQKHGEEKIRFYQADLCEGIDNVLQKEVGIEAVIHYAALCNVGESEKEPGLYFRNNIQGTLGLLESMRKADIKKIVFSSTCAVYGETQGTTETQESEAIDESQPVNPTSHPYGESKYMAERVIDWFQKIHGFEYIFLRYFNVCGATDDGEIGDSKSPSFHLMQNAVRGALGIDTFHLNNTAVATSDGTPIRDYVNVVDLNMAHIKAVDYILSHNNVGEIFNLGTGTGNSVMEIIKTVERITGVSIPLHEAQERRKGDVSKAIASNKKITSVLGWEPEHTLEQSVQSLVAWYTKHPHGWGK